MAIAAVGTLIDITRLLLISLDRQSQLAEVLDRLLQLISPYEADVWLTIVVGEVLAFCTFLGFKDIVNVVE